ncbi:MAG TPA: PHP domain-containing protein [Verrucomicrobiae bacterium]|jgi:UDP-N-acetylglucosamine:LPS N-acetylglucosamine transferase
MKKVLILTAGFGEGHNAAARNIRDALDFVSDDVQVEVLDLFESTYGALNTLMKKSYLGLVQYAPSVWGGIYNLLDNSEMVNRHLGGLTRLRHALGDILQESQPDVVISTYPVYAHVIQELYRDHSERPFRFITIVTDSITVNSAWFRAPSDLFCVPNEETATVLREGGVASEQIRTLGFPVNHVFVEGANRQLETPIKGADRRVLYIINTGKKKAGKVIDRLLEIPNVKLTITVGRDAELKAKLVERTRHAAERVEVLGWTNQMPQLMMSHHVVISKAGGATVQEAIAARCPMVVNQVIPGQEEGNAELIRRLKLGAIAGRNREVSELVEEAFAHRAQLWQEWQANLKQVSRPDASLRIAELILAEAGHRDPLRKPRLFAPAKEAASPVAQRNGSPQPQMLLCDFHMHSNYSDGKLTISELVDLYGRHGFDCICITDHLADPRRLIGKLGRLSRLTLSPNQLDEYFAVIERERRRAWRKYRMHLMAGIEFNKDGLTKKTSAHLLGVDLKAPIRADIDLPETIANIHAQGGLAIASHPHIMKSEWGKNTLFLWENQDEFAPLIDAWEIANRDNIFTPVGLKRLPFVANSDLHKPKHIHSWKTLLHCPKDPEAIKACIRENRDVSITFYRGEGSSVPLRETLPAAAARLVTFPARVAALL